MADDEIKVQISADASGMESGGEKAKASIESIGEAAQGAEGAAAGFQLTMGNLVESFALGELAADAFKETLERLRDAFTDVVTAGPGEFFEVLTKLSEQTGVSTTNLQALEFAAKATGTDFGRVAMSAQQFSLWMNELSTSAAPRLRAAIVDLGLNAATLQTENFYNALEDIGSALQRVGVSTRSIGDVSDIFGGRAGAGIIPLILHLNELSDAAKRAGMIIGEDDVAAGAAAQESLNILAASIDIVGERLKLALVPSLEAVYKGLTESANAAGILASNNSLVQWADQATAAVVNLGRALVQVVEFIAEHHDVIGVALATAGGAAMFQSPTMAGRLAGFAAFEAGWKMSGSAADAATAKMVSDLNAVDAKLATIAENARNAGQGLQTHIVGGETGQFGGGSGGTPPETAAQIKKALDEQFAAVKAEAQDEIALAGDTAQAKVQYLEQVVDFAKSHFPDNSPQVLEAMARESEAQDEYRKQLQADVAQESNDVATMQNAQLSVTKATLEQELAEHKITKAQELAAESQLDDQVIENKIHALQVTQETLDEGTKAYEANAAQIAELSAELSAKQIADQTKVIEAQQEAAKQSLSSWQSAMGQITDALDEMVRGVLQGTQSVSQMFEKMAGDILLSIAKSGIKDLLVGGTAPAAGAAPSLAYSIFGSGLAGILQTAFSTAFQGSGGTLTSVFSNAFSGATGALRSAFTSIFGGATSAAVSGAGGAVAQAGAGVAAATPEITILTAIEASVTVLTSVVPSLLTIISAGITAMIGELTALIAVDTAELAKPSFLGFTFAQGGIVPSAAGGMVTGGGSGASLAILHPREMVLPRNLSEGVQRAINGGGFGGGDGGGGGSSNTRANEVHFHVNAIDQDSVASFFEEHGDRLADLINSKMSGGRAVQEGYGVR